MPLIVRDIKLDLAEPEEVLPQKVAGRLKLPVEAIRQFAPVRRSLDARRRGEMGFAYTVELALHDGAAAERRCLRKLNRADVAFLVSRDEPPLLPGNAPLRRSPVVVGFGPAGMFAAWQLAECGYRPIVLDRGREVRTRHRDVLQTFYREKVFNPESNLLYGEGGAGAYSDGKLYTRVNDPLTDVVLRVLYAHGADPDILIDGRPHIGSDRLPNICMRLRRRIVELGGEIRFGTRVEQLLFDADGSITGLRTVEGDIEADQVLLGIGHSARDTLRMLSESGVAMVAKPFQLGVRLQHPQAMVDGWQYHDHCGHHRLGPAEYHVVARGAAGDLGDVFSFCMCPGGQILPTNEVPNLIATNGASRASRSGLFANSGLVLTLSPEIIDSDPLKGLAYLAHWEAAAFAAGGGDYALPCARARDLLEDRSSDGPLELAYPFGGRWNDLRGVLPDFVIKSVIRGIALLGNRLPGFAGTEALVTAPESRASSPLRIVRHTESRQSTSHPGLYPIGEGAGYAGGIISAAIDGIRSARMVISRCAPPR